jgi:hypothetical protein
MTTINYLLKIVIKATNFSPNRSSSRGINFLNGSQNFVSTTNSTALEFTLQ